MSKTINISVTNKNAVNVSGDVLYICGNSDFVINFVFDDEWDEFDTKTARFVYNSTFQDVVFKGNQCPVPIISNAYIIKVGVFAGNLRTTTPAIVSAKKSILCGNGSPAAPSDDVYNQIMERLQGIGTVNPKDIAAAVAEYLTENPVEAGATTEQAAQIDQNTHDIAALSDEIANWDGGVESYSDLTDKPSINGVELSGKMTNESLGLSSPTAEQVAAAVSDWLNEHPEATTTVEDGSINPDKTTWMRQVFHNSFNKEDNDFRDGYHFYSDGNAATTGGGTANYFVSGYIPVISGKQYFINAAPNQLTTKCFDSLKTYISPLAETALPNGCLLDIPDGVAYIRFSVAKSVMTADTAQVYEYMGEAWEYDTYKNLYSIVVTDAGYSKAIADMVEGKFVDGSLAPADLFADESLRYKQMGGLEEFHWNFVDPDRLEVGNIDANGNDTANTNPTFDYRRTPFLPVSPGEPIRSKDNYAVYIYDADKTLIQSEYVLNIGNPMIMPENAAYIRAVSYAYYGNDIVCNLYRSGYGKNDFFYGADYDYEHCFPMFKTEDSKEGFKSYLGVHPWADKKFCTIGDSFTAPGTWVTIMCANLNAIYHKNHAVSGGAFSDYEGVPKTAYEQAQKMVTNGESPDVILVTLGTNDANNSVTIGEIVESNSISDFDLTTYTGGMQACLNYLQNNFPEAIIYVGWTPMDGLVNGTKVEYITRMQEVCLMYGVEYIETRTCGVTRFSDAYAECYENGVNGGHPTGVGQQKIGAYMTRLMQSKR